MKQVAGWAAPPKARLQEPSGSGYILLAGTIERFGRFARATAARKAALAQAALRAQQIMGLSGVRRVQSFRAALAPADAPAAGPAPRYDVVLLVETASPQVAAWLVRAAPVAALQEDWRRAGGEVLCFAAASARRIAEPPDDPHAVYLFNFFTGPDSETLLEAWEQTAGWFMEETDLDNSLLLQPLPETPAPFGIVNHASWPAFLTFLPALFFKSSFKRYVLETFRINGITPGAILYRRDRRFPA